jgi:hypothetical protein
LDIGHPSRRQQIVGALAICPKRLKWVTPGRFDIGLTCQVEDGVRLMIADERC